MKARRRSSSGSAFTCAPSGVAPVRQGRRIGQRAERQPMDRRAAIGRGFEILAERRAERLLEARLDGHRIEQRRPERIGRRLQRRGDTCLLGAQLGQPRVGLLQQLVGGGIARLGAPAVGGARLLHLDPLGLGPGDGLARGIRLVALGLARLPRSTPTPWWRASSRPGARPRARPRPPASAGRFASSPSIWRCWSATSARRTSSRRSRSCSSAISRLTLLRSASSSAIWRVRRSCSPSAATVVASCASSRACLRPRRARPRRPAPARAGALGIEIGDRGLGVALAAALAGKVALGLLQAGLGLLLRRGDPLGLGGQRIVRHAQALQRRGGGGLFVAQRRQRGRGLGLRRRGEADQPRQVGDLRLGFLQPLAGFGELALGLGELQRQHGRLGAADMVGQVAVAAGLARLALQALVLLLERDQHVLHAGEVLLGGAQPQLGLVAAGIEAGDAGRLVDHAAPVDRLGVDQRADAALADQRGRARARSRRRRTASARRAHGSRGR